MGRVVADDALGAGAEVEGQLRTRGDIRIEPREQLDIIFLLRLAKGLRINCSPGMGLALVLGPFVIQPLLDLSQTLRRCWDSHTSEGPWSCGSVAASPTVTPSGPLMRHPPR